MHSINCFIYRCSAKQDMYIYLAQKDDFDCLPETLRKNLGRTDFAMEIALDENKKLSRENPKDVIANLEKQGFHLQMPSETPVDELLKKVAKENLDKHQE